MKKTQYASFLLPVIDGEIFLGERVKEPNANKFGAIGGKSRFDSGLGLIHFPQYMTKPGGSRERTIADRLARHERREFVAETAVREFCEEVFYDKRYPDDFNKDDITDVVRLGCVVDHHEMFPDTDLMCYVNIGIVNRRDFSLKADELRSMQTLRILSGSQIFPITTIALLQLRFLCEEGIVGDVEQYKAYKGFDLLSQIPTDLHLSSALETSMYGGVHYCLERGLDLPKAATG